MFIRGPPAALIFHAGILVRALVRYTPLPGSGGRSVLLIQVADPPSRISQRFPP